MRSKKRKVFIAALFFIFVFDGGNVFAEDVQLPNDSETENFDNTDGQTDSDTVNIQDEISKANKIKQPFTWTSAGDVLKYEIIIKKKDEATGNYLPYFTHETNDEETEKCIIYIEPLLPVGDYISEIRVYNVLGMLEYDMTTYDEFTVRQAYKPEIKSLSYPLYMGSTMYLDDFDNNGIIEVTGQNLFLYERVDEDDYHTDYTLSSGARALKPEKTISHDDKNRKIELQFDMKKLDVGVYTMLAQDDSGLHSDENSSATFTVKFKKWMDLDVEAGYTFPIVIHDRTLPEYVTRLSPISAQARVSFLPFKHIWGYLGVGARLSYSRMKKEEAQYTIDGNMFMSHLLFLYQMPLNKRRIMLEFHGGVGLTYFSDIKFHFPHNIVSAPLNTFDLSFLVGASMQFYMNKRLYAEVSADYSLTLNKDMVMGVAHPSVGIGWQF